MYLLGIITRHLDKTEISESRFGRIVVNDPRLVSDLRNGREPRPRLVARVCAYIADEMEARR